MPRLKTLLSSIKYRNMSVKELERIINYFLTPSEYDNLPGIGALNKAEILYREWHKKPPQNVSPPRTVVGNKLFSGDCMHIERATNYKRDTSIIELECCPFCGCKFVHIMQNCDNNRHYGKCQGCGAKSGECADLSFAVSGWNMRTGRCEK